MSFNGDYYGRIDYSPPIKKPKSLGKSLSELVEIVVDLIFDN